MSIPLVVGRPAVAKRKVEKPIRPKPNCPAVMVELRFVDAEQLAAARRVDPVCIGRVNAPFGDHVLVIVGRIPQAWRSGNRRSRPLGSQVCV